MLLNVGLEPCDIKNMQRTWVTSRDKCVCVCGGGVWGVKKTKQNKTLLAAEPAANGTHCSKRIIQQTVQLTQHGKVNGVGARLIR